MHELKGVEQVLWMAASTLFFVANIVSTYLFFFKNGGH